MAITSKIRFFARLSELTGIREIEVEVNKGTTVSSLFQELCNRYPELSDYENRLMFAVNAEYVDATQILQGGEEIALIPPVSGGSFIIGNNAI